MTVSDAVWIVLNLFHQRKIHFINVRLKFSNCLYLSVAVAILKLFMAIKSSRIGYWWGRFDLFAGQTSSCESHGVLQVDPNGTGSHFQQYNYGSAVCRFGISMTKFWPGIILFLVPLPGNLPFSCLTFDFWTAFQLAYLNCCR